MIVEVLSVPEEDNESYQWESNDPNYYDRYSIVVSIFVLRA
jgi:hypothetical protein